MSKKHKAAGKKGGNNAKKKASPDKKQGKSASKSSAVKSSAKSSADKSSGTAKKAKKGLIKSILAKKSNKSPEKSKTTKAPKKGLLKKIVKAVKKVVAKKKEQKTATAPLKKAIKSTPNKPQVVSKLKPVVVVGAKQVKPQVELPAAIKPGKNGQHKSNGTEHAKPSPSSGSKNTDTQEKGRKLNDLFTKKPIERKANEVLAITNTIPVKAKNEISPSKIASISYSITNPVKKTDSYAVKPEKEPQGKFELEFVVHASAEMLYEFLSTPSGLSEWFCDDLNIRNGIYTFIWDDQLQQARLLKTIDQQLVRFQWVDKMDGSYFEFRIQRDDLTNDISLIITDFAETVSERESSKLLWHSQVEKLMHVIGSIF
jgi:uncharacterized protein YndB with AHSA1/START domain